MAPLVVVTLVLMAKLLSSLAQGPNESGNTGGVIDVFRAPTVLTSITITPSDQFVGVGGSAHFQAIGTFSDGTVADITQIVAWTAAGATIVAPGFVQAENPAIVTVVASTGKVMARASLTVE